MDQLVIILLFILVILLIVLISTRLRLSAMQREMDFRVEKKVSEVKDRIREETLKRSRATLKGQLAEQVVPFLEEFKYNPSDARFIGSPIDYLIFDGYTDQREGIADKPITIILADVKIGSMARLTSTQKNIKEAVEVGRVKWETIRVGNRKKYKS